MTNSIQCCTESWAIPQGIIQIATNIPANLFKTVQFPSKIPVSLGPFQKEQFE
jgi:hypothetical protein